MRWSFACGVYDLAKRDPRVVLLMGDVGGGLFKAFANDFPKRFFNLGTAEQTMVGMAAGLAHEGFRPVVYTFTSFLLERAFEQIKLDVVHDRARVLLAGWSDETQGPTHKPAWANGALRCLPALRSEFPQTKTDVTHLLNHTDPDYWPMFIELTAANE